MTIKSPITSMAKTYVYTYALPTGETFTGSMVLVVLEESKYTIILLSKITAAQNENALSYHIMRGLYFLAVIFAAIITFFPCQVTWYVINMNL